MAIKQEKAFIQSAENFFSWAKSHTKSSVIYFFVSKEDVELSATTLKTRSSNLWPITGTFVIHAVRLQRLREVWVRATSCYCDTCYNFKNAKCSG